MSFVFTVTWKCDNCPAAVVLPNDNTLPDKWVWVPVGTTGIKHFCLECQNKLNIIADSSVKYKGNIRPTISGS